MADWIDLVPKNNYLTRDSLKMVVLKLSFSKDGCYDST